MLLNNARILLTGATGGLGQALATQFARAGAKVLLVGRDAERLSAIASLLGKEHSSVLADLTRPEDIAATLDAAREFGVNVLVNNAGIGGFGLFEQQEWQAVEQLLVTNLNAPMRLTQTMLPLLKSQPQSAIVNIGSTFGSLPFAGFTAYSAAKAGLRAFSQALRRELADTNVAIIHLAPRAIDTPLNTDKVNALNRALKNQSDTAEHVARLVMNALEREDGERHFGFPEMMFAWINGFAPSLIDRGLSGKLAVIKHYALNR